MAFFVDGTQRDAIPYSVSANSKHGLRRTNADKRKAVLTLLNDEEWSEWSDREIARRCEVSNRVVSNYREESTVNRSQSGKGKAADGRTIDTTNIGSKRNISPARSIGAGLFFGISFTTDSQR